MSRPTHEELTEYLSAIPVETWTQNQVDDLVEQLRPDHPALTITGTVTNFPDKPEIGYGDLTVRSNLDHTAQYSIPLQREPTNYGACYTIGVVGGPDHDGYGTGIPCRTITEAVQACSDMETTGQSDIAMAVAVEDRRRAERAVERAGRGFAAPARAATASRGNSANYGQASASHPHKMTPSVELD